MLVVSLGIPVIIGNIALLIVSSLVKTKKHYSVDSVKSTLMNINISYIVAGDYRSNNDRVSSNS